MDKTVGIGQAAAQLGMEAHVLRHWEEQGIMTPGRTPAGHRRYGEADLDDARLTQRLQRAGLSLNEIRTISNGDRETRESVVSRRLARLEARARETAAAIAFLAHTQTCRHRVVATCSECDAYANPAPAARHY